MKHLILSILVVSGLFTTLTLNSCKGKGDNKDTKEITENKTENAENKTLESVTVLDGGEVYVLTTAEFKSRIYDYSQSSEWKFKGTKPCIIDFYADWCKPCKMVAPIMEELAKQYGSNVIFYKVNTDNEPDLANAFGISSIPSILFCPGDGSQPQIATGAMAKEEYVKIITEVLKVTL